MARYLVDANLPRYLPVWAGDSYVFVADIDPQWTDGEIWDHASAEGLTVITKDADFSDRALMSTVGPPVIHIRVGNMKLRDFQDFLARIWDDVCRLSVEFRLVQVYGDRIETIT